MTSAADIWDQLAALPRPTLGELFSAVRDGGEGADEPGGADRVAMLSGRIALDEGGILFDWSKTHLDRAVIARFEQLAEAMDFASLRAKLFAGEVVNPTEGRAADHATLRGTGEGAKVEEAMALIDRMGMLVEAIHQGALGEIEHLIHIGIGGSALGPALGVDALGRDLSYCDVHVVSNIDGVALEAAFAKCDPAKTLIAVASKTFTTIETMTNAASALKWLGDNGVSDPGGRVIALTANPEGAVEWGVDETRILPFQESVGGRYSIWSSIGFPIAMAVGMDDFRAMLAGAKAV
ncbi:MAG: glucose-6-phosphate isomerase, partial [Qipengyuania sp.]